MNKADLIRRFTELLEDAERNRAYTVIEVEIRDGRPILVRTVKTEKVEYRGNESHAQRNYR